MRDSRRNAVWGTYVRCKQLKYDERGAESVGLRSRSRGFVEPMPSQRLLVRPMYIDEKHTILKHAVTTRCHTRSSIYIPNMQYDDR